MVVQQYTNKASPKLLVSKVPESESNKKMSYIVLGPKSASTSHSLLFPAQTKYEKKYLFTGEGHGWPEAMSLFVRVRSLAIYKI